MSLPLSHKITVSTSPKLKLGHDSIGLRLSGRKALLPAAFAPLIRENNITNLAQLWADVAESPQIVAKVTGWTDSGVKHAVAALGKQLAKVLTSDELEYMKSDYTPPNFGGGYMLEPAKKTKLAASAQRAMLRKKSKA